MLRNEYILTRKLASSSIFYKLLHFNEWAVIRRNRILINIVTAMQATAVDGQKCKLGYHGIA